MRTLTRRGFIATAATVTATLPMASRASASTDPRVVIVGAGLAGLRCAHRLWTGTRPVRATVYDADTTHVGGRCWSLRGFFDGGLVAERGGSFISSTDNEILRLAGDLGLQRESVYGGALAGDYAAWIDGALYTGVQQQQDWVEQAYSAFHSSYLAAGTARYDRYNAEAYRLDHLSCLDYLDEIGLDPGSRLGQVIQSLQLQSGGEPADSSALGMISFLGQSKTFDGGHGFDEKYHIVGGNDQIVSGMVGGLPAGTVQQGYQLLALRRNHDDSYTCTFDHGGSTVTVLADHVVLALPFSTLRNVDLAGASLSPLKLTAVRQQGMGQSGKITVQLSRKTWPSLGYNGITNTGPQGYQTAWDGSTVSGATGTPALQVVFPGGNVARDTLTGATHGPAPAADVNWFLSQIEHMYPGTTAAYTGKAYEDHWSRAPWQLGGYHYYRTGQYTSIAGYEAVQEGRIHFAGEHTDVDNATLNAAVASGERAACEILGQI
ncbi:flavin monoamine oxidase family protein [Nonomuraea sp. NPDC050536]|uniref:flavin monoamine oxidase family protein n=1 Tax=Nonomuraea sp. NPDC050536 TaxID=3364366 RepID=UPI0037CB841A